MTLTTKQIRALKDADSVSFSVYNGETLIKAWFRETDEVSEYTVTISTEYNTVHNYGTGGENGYACFAMIGSSKYDAAWQTIVHDMRTGCAVALKWTRNNSSPVLDEAGIVQDHLDMTVQNPSGRARTYRVATYVGRDNTARMVRLA